MPRQIFKGPTELQTVSQCFSLGPKNIHPAAFVASSHFCHNKTAHGWSTSTLAPFESRTTKAETWNLWTSESYWPRNYIFQQRNVRTQKSIQLMKFVDLMLAVWFKVKSKNLLRNNTYSSHKCADNASPPVYKKDWMGWLCGLFD